MKIIPNVYFISGGSTSAYMVINRVASENDIFIFNDTEREHIKTYEFLNNVEKYCGIHIHRVKNKENFHQLVKRKGMPPNRTKRYCTQELKVRSSKRYLRQFLCIQRFNAFIGFRYDEPQRVKNRKQYEKKVSYYFPLYDLKITKPQITYFFETQMSFKLEIPHVLGNCDLCFMKGKNAIIAILKTYPELAERWIKDEAVTNGTFIKGISYAQMLDYAKRTLTFFPLHEITPQYSCACSSF